LSVHLTGKVIEGLLEVGKTYIPVDIKSFHLVKEAMGACGDGFIAVYPSRHDGTYGWPGLFQHPDLHVGGVRAQEDIRISGDKELALHSRGRMFFRKIHAREVMPTVFVFGSLPKVDPNRSKIWMIRFRVSVSG